MLPTLARENGGVAITSVKNFADAIQKLVNDTGNSYKLSFDSIPATTADEFHSIEVKVDRPGVNVHSATGYYAQP